MGFHAKVEPYDRARFLMKIASSLGGDAQEPQRGGDAPVTAKCTAQISLSHLG